MDLSLERRWAFLIFLSVERTPPPVFSVGGNIVWTHK
jgi:hypothetical protein